MQLKSKHCIVVPAMVLPSKDRFDVKTIFLGTTAVVISRKHCTRRFRVGQSWERIRCSSNLPSPHPRSTMLCTLLCSNTPVPMGHIRSVADWQSPKMHKVDIAALSCSTPFDICCVRCQSQSAQFEKDIGWSCNLTLSKRKD